MSRKDVSPRCSPAAAQAAGLPARRARASLAAMHITHVALAALAAVSLAPIAAQAQDASAEAIAADWQTIPDDEILVMTLAGGKQVYIRLAARYAPAHVANIRKLAQAHWWDGTAVYRLQDNYVAQWGDPDEEKALPPEVLRKLPAEYDWPGYDGVTTPARPDSYAAKTGHSADGWTLASDGSRSWLTHCYGMVGVARNLAPDTGDGSALYAVIGHAPRHLDRNIALVGRVIEGIEHLSSLPRGTEQLGLYATPGEYTGILSVRLASQLPADERPRFAYRAADNERFAAWVAARENRQPPFFEVPAGGADICNMQPSVRRISG